MNSSEAEEMYVKTGQSRGPCRSVGWASTCVPGPGLAHSMDGMPSLLLFKKQIMALALGMPSRPFISQEIALMKWRVMNSTNCIFCDFEKVPDGN